ncbi:MAG: NUDIX hydrolase [Patescibacteria group bacterium]
MLKFLKMKKSAGIIVYRKINDKYQILLAHIGGPFWKNKKNSWDIPKGELKEKENPMIAAIREFQEETGLKLTKEDKEKLIYFGEFERKPFPYKNAPQKIIYFYLLNKDFGDNLVPKSNLVKMEYPPKSKNFLVFPEIDRIAYFDLEKAKEISLLYLHPVLDKLDNFLKNSKIN